MRIIGETVVAFSPKEALDLVIPRDTFTLRQVLARKAFVHLRAAGLADRADSGWWARVSIKEYGGYLVAFYYLRKPGPPGAVPEPRHMKCPRCGWEGDLLLDADGMPDGVVPVQRGEEANETHAHDRAGTSPDHDEGAGTVGAEVLA